MVSKGTGVALITPFHQDGSIDFPALEKLVHHVIEGGVDYLVVMGTTGESPVLSDDEKKQLFREVARFNQGRVSLVAGIGGNNTPEVRHAMQAMPLDGYEAILSVSPYYNKPNQEGIFHHYMALADTSPLPIILYNVPGRTGSSISPTTTLRLAEHKNIIATKEASGNLDACMEILRQAPDGFSVISGDDAYTLPFMALGMTGVISVVANAYPFDFSEMVKALMHGEYEKAKRIHFKLLPFIHLLFADGSPGGIKYVLSKMGICQAYLRQPLWPIGEETRRKLDEWLTNQG